MPIARRGFTANNKSNGMTASRVRNGPDFMVLGIVSSDMWAYAQRFSPFSFELGAVEFANRTASCSAVVTLEMLDV